MTRLALRHAVPLVALGGALGAVARWAVTTETPSHTGSFPWAVFAINVLGSALLAALPAVAAVRRSPGLAVFLGTGVLGGFTTMSTASEQTADLLRSGQQGTALAYVAGTLLCAVAAALAVDRWSTPEERREFEAEEGDE